MIVGLLLAAGGARRFGSQKLIHPFDGRPLVRHAAEVLAAATGALVVVVGNGANAVSASLEGLGARIVENPHWSDGLSTSLRAGIAALPSDAEAAIVCLGDQPRVSGDVIRRVIETWRATRLPIVSARYRGTRGHPVLFDAAVFSELGGLSGDAGARMLIERDATRVGYVDVDAAVPGDVDSPDDLKLVQETE
ncbi:MAG: nucleotidyltransferase family protein [Gemmatimonadaceae bacterium]